MRRAISMAETARYLRLRSYEYLIFAVLFILFALCLAALPFIAPPEQSAREQNSCRSA